MKTSITEALEKLTIDEPQAFEHLALFPLVSPGEGEPRYITLGEALRGNHARVTEAGQGGSVPELVLENPSPHHVLLLEGDELVGAKQNRVINVTILVAPEAKLTIPVSCVERGRWSYRSADFAHDDRMMFAKGRAEKIAQVSASIRSAGTRRSDQGEIWRMVAEKAHAFHAPSPTGAMSDVYECASSSIGEYRRAFTAARHQVGAVFAIGGRSVGLELFDTARTLGSTLGRLVGSYALDALEEPQTPHPAPGLAEARAFLRRVAGSRAEEVPAVGLGTEVRLEAPGLVGEALVVDGRVLHLSALELPGEEARMDSARARARTLSRRRSGGRY